MTTPDPERDANLASQETTSTTDRDVGKTHGQDDLREAAAGRTGPSQDAQALRKGKDGLDVDKEGEDADPPQEVPQDS